MIRLDGKVALVTGGASGIGRATAMLFASLGALVVVGDIDDGGAAETASAIDGAGGTASWRLADVADAEQMAALVAYAVETHGRLDVLVNNAGAVGPDTYGRDSTVVDVDLDLWDRILDINLRGVMLGCRFAIPYLVANGGGSIVNLSSIDALTGRWGQVAYGVSKAGVNALTQYVATTHGRDGVRCNAVAPGLIMSPVAEAALSPQARALSAANRIVAEAGTPDDVAGLIAYLASDAARFVTGQVWAIDGGTLCHHPLYGSAIGGLTLP